MTQNSVNSVEIQTLRTIARHAADVEAYRVAIIREDEVGTGSLSQRATHLLEASQRLDGMVAIAEETGLFNRVGGDIRRMVLAGREPREEDFEFGGVPVFYVGS